MGWMYSLLQDCMWKYIRGGDSLRDAKPVNWSHLHSRKPLSQGHTGPAPLTGRTRVMGPCRDGVVGV